jgi:hypothetical protein
MCRWFGTTSEGGPPRRRTSASRVQRPSGTTHPHRQPAGAYDRAIRISCSRSAYPPARFLCPDYLVGTRGTIPLPRIPLMSGISRSWIPLRSWILDGGTRKRDRGFRRLTPTSRSSVTLSAVCAKGASARYAVWRVSLPEGVLSRRDHVVADWLRRVLLACGSVL